MAATKEEIKELAEHIYDLDAEVYVHLGSSLGRVFNRDRERCVNELTELLTTRPQGHLVRSELGLIANIDRFLVVVRDADRNTAYTFLVLLIIHRISGFPHPADPIHEI